MPTSEDEVQAARERVEDLRAQVNDAEAERVSREQAASNDLLLAELGAEAARLEARLVAAKDATNADPAQQLPMQSAREAMEAAAASQAAEEEASRLRAEAAENPPEVTQPVLPQSEDPSRTPDGEAPDFEPDSTDEPDVPSNPEEVK